MREFAIVKEIRKNKDTGEEEVFVLPMIVSACQYCRTGCLKQGKAFKVANKKSLALKPGTVVRIGLPRRTLALHGLLSFLGPIAAAIAGFIFAPEISERLFGAEFTALHFEKVRAATTAISLVAASAALFVISRSSIHFTTPEVHQIV